MVEVGQNDWHEAVLSGLETGPTGLPQIEGWQLTEKPLGIGAFGATFFAQKRLHFNAREIFQTAAFKVLNPSVHDGRGVEEMFVSEVDALARVDSRFVAKLLDAGVERNVPWIALEFINGMNLQNQLSDRRKLDLYQWATLTEHSLRGLATAHDESLLHLDIKPANIMFSTNDSSYSLVDFGIARLQQRWGLRLKSFAGTGFYAAPEIFKGEYSKSSDVFSLGTTLYEAFTGLNPWIQISKEMNLPKGIDFFDAYKISLLREPDWSLVPPEVQSILQPMLSKEPGFRPAPRIALAALSNVRLTDRLEQISEVTRRTHTTALELHATWQMLKERIADLIDRSGIREFKLDVHSDESTEISFRVKLTNDERTVTCTTPENPRNLIALGWSPSPDVPVMCKVIGAQTGANELSEIVSQALESGYGLNIEHIQLA